jgi:hypothetical protein
MVIEIRITAVTSAGFALGRYPVAVAVAVVVAVGISFREEIVFKCQLVSLCFLLEPSELYTFPCNDVSIKVILPRRQVLKVGFVVVNQRLVAMNCPQQTVMLNYLDILSILG